MTAARQPSAQLSDAAHQRNPSRGRTAIALFTVVAAMSLAACSDSSDPEAATTTTSTTTTAPSTSAPAPSEQPAEEAPSPEWIIQVGGPADDALNGIAGRDDEVIAVGYTDGVVSWTGPADSGRSEGSTPGETASLGGRDALAAVVGTDSGIRSIEQGGGPGDDSALGVGSAAGTTISCGATASDLGAPNAGASDAWCASVGPLGELDSYYQQGGTESDELAAAAVEPQGSIAYAAGNTLGLFPGASDSSAGQLGAGDVIVWQLNGDGTPRWIRQFGTISFDTAHGVATTEDGDGLVAGDTDGDLDGPSNGDTDGFIARFDQDGLPRFVRQFGTDGADSARAITSGGVATRGTETFVAVGETDGALAPALGGELTDPADAPRADGAEPAPNNAGETDAMIVAVDPSGETRWTAQLGTDAADVATGVAIDGTTVLVSGTTSGAIDTSGNPSAGGRDGFLAAFDLETGALRWITQFGSDGDEDVNAMTVTEDGLVVIAGNTTGDMGENVNSGGSDGFLIAFPLPSAGGSVASAL